MVPSPIPFLGGSGAGRPEPRGSPMGTYLCLPGIIDTVLHKPKQLSQWHREEGREKRDTFLEAFNKL